MKCSITRSQDIDSAKLWAELRGGWRLNRMSSWLELVCSQKDSMNIVGAHWGSNFFGAKINQFKKLALQQNLGSKDSNVLTLVSGVAMLRYYSAGTATAQYKKCRNT